MTHVILPFAILGLVILATAACSVNPSGDLDVTGTYRSPRASPPGPAAPAPSQGTETPKGVTGSLR